MSLFTVILFTVTCAGIASVSGSISYILFCTLLNEKERKEFHFDWATFVQISFLFLVFFVSGAGVLIGLKNFSSLL